ncbi:phosphotransferase family protein [Halomarina oriensis]|uniref:Phosphotransferase n=1 Tax=Halomarina oriensis TaxID=671145 RepID=A0A6B0GDJ7_9EURY|nr:phosphotransferase [Halomarina oriensis]MWG32986.1 phosphotransferase [Halomarina oriensis]
MDDRVETALSRAFPDRAVTDVGTTGPSWNHLNETVRVTFAAADPVYLKVTSDDAARIARERAVVEYVGANRALPVPTVLACDTDGTVPYLVTEPVDGPTLVEPWSEATDDERATLARQVGTSLARLHEGRFGQAGHVLGGDADGLDLDTAPWSDVLTDWVAWYRGYSPSERFDHHFDAVLDAVEATREALDAAPAALLHTDTATPNCFVGAEGVGFLDWEIALVGDPAWDLTRGRHYLVGVRDDAPERVVEAFFDGYRETADGLPTGYHERVPVYRAVWLLSWSGFFENYLDFVEESPAELARWVETTMEHRLADLA